jgi:hypothetical protein
MGKEKAYRAKLLRALHAEGLKRGIDHEGLRELFNTRSLASVETADLQRVLFSWGKRVRSQALPRKGYAKKPVAAEMVSGEDLTLLGDAFQRRGWSDEQRRNFIRRQLGGRDVVRSRKDFHRVFSGVRAMNRRDENK